MRYLRNHYPSSVVFARNLTTGQELGSEVTDECQEGLAS
jgi:hypothetical protein